MSVPIDAVLIAVGSELSTGQVTNTNSAWLAQQLTELGFQNMLHWTVPDERSLLKDALEQAQKLSSCILLTGGLGPTSDDFTREVVAESIHKELLFSEASWARLQARAQQGGYHLSESQQQQCWFPSEAQILVNTVGTADAFVSQYKGCSYFVLPGPPFEIKTLWDTALKAALKPLLPEQPETKLYTWQCLGIPEGTLGEYVDTALADENVSVGYRAHFPYIEIKVWIPTETPAAPIVHKVEQALASGTLLPGKEDGARRFLNSLVPETEVLISDFASGGALAAALQAAWPSLPEESDIQIQLNSEWTQAQQDPQRAMAELAEPDAEPHQLKLTLGGISAAGEWSLGLQQFDNLQFERFQLPFQRKLPLQQRYIAEMALITWEKWLHAE